MIPSNASLPLLRWPGGSDARGLPVGPPCLVGGRYIALPRNWPGRGLVREGPCLGPCKTLFLCLILRTSFLRKAEKEQRFVNLAERSPGRSQPAGGLGHMISKGQQFHEKLAAYKEEGKG